MDYFIENAVTPPRQTGPATIHEFKCRPGGALPRSVFSYVLGTSGLHQFFLLLMVGVFLLEVVPLELHRRIVNDLVEHRPYSWIVGSCAVYAGTVLVQGGTKLALNIYRGWVRRDAKPTTPNPSSPRVAHHGVPMMPIRAAL